MCEISCDVCLDLIPLVQDNVASDESVSLVNAHVQNCESCRQIFTETPLISNHQVDDKKIIHAIKRNLLFIASAILLLGSILGVALSNSSGMFYNFLIMPMIGAIGYFTLSKRFYLVPLCIFILSYFWLLISFIIEGSMPDSSILALLLSPLYLSIIYTALSLLGIFIAWLLKFAFKKEV